MEIYKKKSKRSQFIKLAFFSFKSTKTLSAKLCAFIFFSETVSVRVKMIDMHAKFVGLKQEGLYMMMEHRRGIQK